jgi:hypothetical protein
MHVIHKRPETSIPAVNEQAKNPARRGWRSKPAFYHRLQNAPDPIIRSFLSFFVESAFLQLTYLRTAAVFGPSDCGGC